MINLISRHQLTRVALLSPLLGVLVGCQDGSKLTVTSASALTSDSAGASAPAPLKATFDVNRFPVNKLVCNPTGGSTPTASGGLQASLFWLDASQPRYGNLTDFYANAHESEHTFFFSQLNTPTRLFTAGFPTQTGSMIQDDQGNNLIEYFGLQFQTVLQLAPEQAEGTYQFALLADDGATMQVEQAGVYNTVIDDDQTHPTKMGCSTITLKMDHTTQFLTKFNYYNGPRYHIAMVAMMRKTDGTNPQDSLCNQNGNSLFFDPDHGSVPQQAYKDLLARGWQVMGSGNFALPNTAMTNPCVDGTPAIISDFHVVKSDYYSIEVSWTTNTPTTSQVNYTNVASGSNALTISDNTLSTTHDVVISGLLLNTSYSLQAIAISADYGKTFATPIVAKTLNVE